jgi:hypothetical protein
MPVPSMQVLSEKKKEKEKWGNKRLVKTYRFQ